MGDTLVYYSSLLMILGLGYQMIYNAQCMIDMGGSYYSLSVGIYYIGALIPGLLLSIYSMKLASSKIALRKNNNPENFAKLWASENTYSNIAKVY